MGSSSRGMASMSKVGVLARPDEGHRVLDDVEVAQPEEVHLEEAELLHPVHLVLGDDRGLLGRQPVLRLALDGQVVGQRVLGDHHGGGVDAVLAAEALEALGHVDDPLHVRVGVVHGPQLGRRLVAVLVLGVEVEAGVQWGVAPHDEGRHGLGHPVTDGVRVAEHPGGVAYGGPGLDGGEGDDLGHVVAAVALGGVADHLVPVAGVEVHVDVRHGDAARVEEALEQQVVADGVEVGDAQAVGDGAAGGAPPAGPDPDARLAGVVDQVPDDQEVGAEAHLGDDPQLVVEPFQHRRRDGVAPPLLGALEGEVAQVLGVGGEGRRQRELGQLGRAEVDGDVGPLGDPQRVVARLGHLLEEVAHLGRRLQVVLVALELEPLRVAHEGARLHAQQGVVGEVVLAVGVVAVVGGQQRRADPPGDGQQLRVRLALGGQALVLQFHEQVVAAEDVLQAARLLQRPPLVPRQQRLQDVAAEAAGAGDQALVVALQQLPVHPGLVVVALEEGQAGELDEVAVADVVLGEEGEVVVELPAALGVAPGVVDAAPAGGALVAALVGHVHLGADDRGDALVAAGGVELEDAVHVPVVGDAEGRLAVGRRRRHQRLQAGGAVEHRILGVHVQVGKGISQLPARLLARAPEVPRLHGCSNGQ